MWVVLEHGALLVYSTKLVISLIEATQTDYVLLGNLESDD